MNLSKMEFLLLKHLNLQPSEIAEMEFYRLEYLIEHFKEWNEEEKKKREKEESKQKKEQGSMMDYKKELKKQQKSQGNFSKPKLPKFKL